MRPTQEIITPVGKNKILIKEWMTGREQEYIQEPIINAVSFRQNERGTADMTDFKTSAISESTHRTVEMMVVSIDGKPENILNTALDMHKDDYEFIIAEIEKIIKKK